MALKPLEHIVLGLLLEQPCHGYALKQALSPALPRKKLVNDGILYPLLRRLESAGLVRKKARKVAGRPDRNVFHVTAAGRKAFEAWLASDADEADEVTYDFFVGHPFLGKHMFLGQLGPAQARAKLEAQRTAVVGKLAAFERIRAGMTERGVDPHRISILELGIEQTRAKKRWLERTLDSLGSGPRRGKKRAS